MLDLDLVLYQPEIPPNTGNVIRLCANSGARLHLIRPLGFELDDARLRRAGLDYHEWASLRVHDDLETFLTAVQPPRLLACSARARHWHSAFRYQPGDAVILGPETRGLPQTLLDDLPPEHCLRIPMRPDQRSLNLSNAAAVIVFEAWRQAGYPGAV